MIGLHGDAIDKIIRIMSDFVFPMYGWIYIEMRLFLGVLLWEFG